MKTSAAANASRMIGNLSLAADMLGILVLLCAVALPG